MALEFTTSCLQDSGTLFRQYKKLADSALAQVKDEDFFVSLDAESNSLAVIIQHIAGNLRSRWIHFLTTDGEKPDRDRDSEFVEKRQTREVLMEDWERAWRIVFDTLATLTDADMSRTVTIRGEAHSVTQAIHRQIAHNAYHCGQIVFLARHFASANWTPLSIPRGKSAEFNAKVRAGKASQR